ncbi:MULTISPECIES: ABC transporter ATP-binding protein [unclassified Devosia]|uniref:ABC transporter ATP-binding protein n=1 Tax=unclassified Devosia TaxID=196773 RepID=UPI00145E517C|nr:MULTISPECIES: ABC transporter ATP-binding protein [unclassified Devosia]MBJ6989106.1 ABC transporter ATP-binding protein [Devosia sp. MC521]QMW63307.1 ABC transporter ATP-binding protein [Devosia sp. MC521]
MTAALEVSNLTVTYGAAIIGLEDVSMSVPEGGIVALLGANGAGKSTMLKAISGLLQFENGRATPGAIRYRGKDMTSAPSYKRARDGILHVREGRYVFTNLTVEENLDAAAFARDTNQPGAKRNHDEIYHYFPQLAARKSGFAGFLSGGEQQMLAIGRALYARPKLLMVDEASMGLAPKIAAEIFQILAKINQEQKLSILVVEQNVGLALQYASYGYVLESGRIVQHGSSDQLLDRDELSKRYLGG